MNYRDLAVLADADAADDLRARSAVRQIGDANRFAEDAVSLTDDSGLRDRADTVVAAVVPAVIALVAAPVLIVAAALRIIALCRSECRRKGKRSYKKRKCNKFFHSVSPSQK